MRLWQKRDAYLSQAIRTERFDLVPCGVADAFNLTWRWTRDKEILTNMTFNTSPRTKLQWYMEFDKPNKFDKFTHAIIPHGQQQVIGVSRTRLVPYKVAIAEGVIHDLSWRGKGVIPETRRALFRHFFKSDRIEKFKAFVHSGNHPSIANCRKLGFQQAGLSRRAQCDPATGIYYDIITFELLQIDWEVQNTEP